MFDWCSWRRVNLILTCVWGVMIPLALVTGWVYSLLFISACSIYANLVSHLAAWRADVPIEKEGENGDEG